MPDGSGDAIIPSLPKHLRIIPGYSSLTDDSWRQKWFAKRDAILEWREDVHLAAEHDKGFQENERFLCADDPKYFAAVWGWIHEPRARKNQRRHVPAIPFAFQCHYMDWLTEIASDPEQRDGLGDKCRGIGLSWATVQWVVHGWDFLDLSSLILSRTQAEVDKPNNLNTLFGKALYIIDRTPQFLLPEGFNRDRDRTQMNIANPETMAQIFGDSTTAEAGRGDRASITFVDEAPFIRDLQDVLRSVSGTSDHTVLFGSPSIKYGMTWINMLENARQTDPDSVMTLDWWLNPFQNEAWRQREYARREKLNDLVGYYIEIERNWTKGRTNLVYPEARTARFDGPGYQKSLPLLIAIDPGTINTYAIIFGQPLDGDPRHGTVNWFDSIELYGLPGEFYGHLLSGLPAVPGDLCYGMSEFNDPNVKRIMALMRDQPWSNDWVRMVMDPAGKQVDSGNLSFQLRIIQQSKKSRVAWVEAQMKAGKKAEDLPKPKALTPMCDDIVSINNHEVRNQAARDLYRRSSFADTPGARRIPSAMAMYRKQDISANATREPVPIHDEECSDIVTAFEYAGCYASGGYFGIKKKEKSQVADWEEPTTDEEAA